MRLLALSFALSLSILSFVDTAAAADGNDARIESLFPELRKLSTAGGAIALYYPAKSAEVLKAKHPDADKAYENGIADLERPLRVRLNGDTQWFTIDCDTGPSADPSCTFYVEANGKLKPVGSAGGERFVFPGNGIVYVDGRSNQMYNLRSKYAWDGAKFKPVEQPFQYVGLETKTTRPIELFADKAQTQPVAKLPKGSPITVLLNEIVEDGDDRYDAGSYLVKTPFGLIGWVRIEHGVYDTGIEHLKFYGD